MIQYPSTMKKRYQMFLGKKYPDYYRFLPQNTEYFKEFAIMETTYHPKHNNYAVTFLNDLYKFWLNIDVDWEKNKINKILDSRYYKVNSEGRVDEENIIEINPSYKKSLQELGLRFFKESAEFRKKYPPLKFPDTLPDLLSSN